MREFLNTISEIPGMLGSITGAFELMIDEATLASAVPIFFILALVNWSLWHSNKTGAWLHRKVSNARLFEARGYLLALLPFFWLVLANWERVEMADTATKIILGVSGILAAIAVILFVWGYSRLPDIKGLKGEPMSDDKQPIVNQTFGPVSPIISGNSGPVTFSPQFHAAPAARRLIGEDRQKFIATMSECPPGSVDVTFDNSQEVKQFADDITEALVVLGWKINYNAVNFLGPGGPTGLIIRAKQFNPQTNALAKAFWEAGFREIGGADGDRHKDLEIRIGTLPA